MKSIHYSHLIRLAVAAALLVGGVSTIQAARVQEAAPATPTEHVLGTVTAIDAAAHTITVKDDKSAAEAVISVGQTRSIFRVQPGAKDLKGATRISAADLAAGDRVDVRGFKDTTGTGVVARSVVLMSATDLAQKRQQEQDQWQNSTAGTVTAVNPAAHSFSISARSAEGPKPVTVQTAESTTYTRYSPENPKTPVVSDFASVQQGDQLHIIGQKSEDGATISAQKIYSAAVRTLAATVTSVAPDGKQLTVRNLQNKQPMTVLLTDTSAVRKLEPDMAAMLARRFNPGTRAAGPAGGGAPAGSQANAENGQPSAPPAGGEHGERAAAGGDRSDGPGGNGQAGPGGASPRRGGGDLSHMLERVPLVTATDLKPGNAVVIWGVGGGDPNTVTAQIVLAGVEPVLQSAPQRQGQSLNANWNLDMSVPAQ